MDAKQRYSGKVLSVLWTIQFVLVPLHILAVAFIIMEYHSDLGYVPAVYIVELCFFSLCFLIMPVEISGYLFNFLNPWWFLVSQVFKSLFYTIFAAYGYFLVSQVPLSLSRDFWNIWRWVNVGFVTLLLITYLVELSYGGVVLHRYRKLGAQYDKVDYIEDTQYPPARPRRNNDSISRPMMTV